MKYPGNDYSSLFMTQSPDSPGGVHDTWGERRSGGESSARQ